MTQKTALITGASGGIGSEFARLLARQGYHLILVARNEDALRRLGKELQETYAATVLTLPCDFSVPHAAEYLAKEVDRHQLSVDILINNAGFGTHGPFASLPMEKEIAEIMVNIVALTAVTKLFLPAMIARESGKILNVASTAAFQPGPYMAVYYASKAYVLSFSEALAQELKGSGITVTALCPGATKTPFFARAKMARTVLLRHAQEPSVVARVGLEGLMRGKRVVIPGWTNRLGAFFSALLPRDLVLRIVSRVNTSFF